MDLRKRSLILFLLGGMVLQFIFFRGSLVDPVRRMVEAPQALFSRVALVLLFAGPPTAFGLTIARWVWLPKELYSKPRRHLFTWLLTVATLALGTAVHLVTMGDYKVMPVLEAVSSTKAWSTGIAVCITALYSAALALSGYKWLAPIVQAVDYTRLRSLLQRLVPELTREPGSLVTADEKRLSRLWLEEQETILRGIREEAGKNLQFEDLPEFRTTLTEVRSDAVQLAAFFGRTRDENQLADLPLLLRGERGGFVTIEIQKSRDRLIAAAQGCGGRRGG